MIRSRSGALTCAAIVAALILTPTVASAQAKPGVGHADDLLTRRLAGVKVLKRGSLAQMRGRMVSVGGGKTVAIGDLAASVFAEQSALAGELKKGRAGLMADPASNEEVIETDDATVLVMTTAAIVTNPAKLAAASPRFKRFRKRGDKPTVADLNAEGKAGFAKFKQSLAKRPADHPLKQALGKGDAALLEAVSAGVGDLVITTAVVVPKNDLTVKEGVVQMPTLGKDGRLDGKKTRPGKRRFQDSKAKDPAEKVKKSVKEKGRLVHKAEFLTGFTVGDAFEWSRRWKFPSGHFEIRAGAYYGFGVRAPVAVKAVLTPALIAVKGPKDRANKYQVEITAKTLDGSKQYYAETGLAADKLFDGKELVLEAGFHLGYTFKAGWGAFKKHGRVGKDFDEGKHFRPPFGKDCVQSGGGCGVEMWIPPSATGTGVKIGGKNLHIGGAAYIGFLLAGSGNVTVKYESVYGDGTLKSERKSGGGAKKMHTLTFDSPRAITMKTAIDPLGRPGSRNFGLRLSEPVYRWMLRIIPGLKVEVDIKAGKFVDRTFSTGAMWMNSLGIDVGTLKLNRHPGTVKKFYFKEGVRSWSKK